MVSENQCILLYKKYGSISKVVDSLGIDIQKREFPQKTLESRIMINCYGDTTIFIRPDIDEYHYNFLLAHELGHYVLPPIISKISSGRRLLLSSSVPSMSVAISLIMRLSPFHCILSRHGHIADGSTPYTWTTSKSGLFARSFGVTIIPPSASRSYPNAL